MTQRHSLRCTSVRKGKALKETDVSVFGVSVLRLPYFSWPKSVGPTAAGECLPGIQFVLSLVLLSMCVRWGRRVLSWFFCNPSSNVRNSQVTNGVEPSGRCWARFCHGVLLVEQFAITSTWCVGCFLRAACRPRTTLGMLQTSVYRSRCICPCTCLSISLYLRVSYLRYGLDSVWGDGSKYPQHWRAEATVCCCVSLGGQEIRPMRAVLF